MCQYYLMENCHIWSYIGIWKNTVLFLQVYCSRYVKEHMVKHGETTGHPMVLSYADLSNWCYGCDNYVDNEVIMLEWIFPVE